MSGWPKKNDVNIKASVATKISVTAHKLILVGHLSIRRPSSASLAKTKSSNDPLSISIAPTTTSAGERPRDMAKDTLAAIPARPREYLVAGTAQREAPSSSHAAPLKRAGLQLGLPCARGAAPRRSADTTQLRFLGGRILTGMRPLLFQRVASPSPVSVNTKPTRTNPNFTRNRLGFELSDCAVVTSSPRE